MWVHAIVILFAYLNEHSFLGEEVKQWLFHLWHVENGRMVHSAAREVGAVGEALRLEPAVSAEKVRDVEGQPRERLDVYAKGHRLAQQVLDEQMAGHGCDGPWAVQCLH